MKKIFAFILFSACTLCAWAQTVVTTEDELVAAVLTDGANIQFGNDITVAKHVTISTNLDGEQRIDNVSAKFGGSAKVIRNGLLFIERNGKIYNAQGALVK